MATCGNRGKAARHCVRIRQAEHAMYDGNGAGGEAEMPSSATFVVTSPTSHELR